MNYLKTAALLAAMTALFAGVGYVLGGSTGAILALILALGMNGYVWWNSDALALRRHNAREILPNARSGPAAELYRLVDGLAKNANLPTPRVYIIQTEQPNAFATGRNPENAAVAVTTGIMRALDREEMAGVIAHELAHIKNRDTLIMTIAASFAGAISTLAQFGYFFRTDSNRNPLGIVGVLLAVIAAPFAAMLVQMAISRTREYAADRMGAQICGQPAWLASALMKISAAASRRPMASAERHPETAHLFIINPLTGWGADRLFSTHPSTEKRVNALNDLARELGKPVFGARGGYASRGDGGILQEDPERRPRRRSPWGSRR